MRFIVWILIGLLAGFLGSKIVTNQGQGLFVDLILGLVGSFVGGFLFGLLGFQGKGIIYHIVVSTVGAAIVLVLYSKLMH
ncbi:MAG TPA: GlsB/YeaQ/YmgE family stress response membrane protein [Humisphaera sp.]|nr:GlsB/YeaQ/YmgE family stress response membrane protein [Humisphaera sp.]